MPVADVEQSYRYLYNYVVFIIRHRHYKESSAKVNMYLNLKSIVYGRVTFPSEVGLHAESLTRIDRLNFLNLYRCIF